MEHRIIIQLITVMVTHCGLVNKKSVVDNSMEPKRMDIQKNGKSNQN